MTLERIRYRVGQFREALGSAPDPADLKLAQDYLNPAQMELFSRMQNSEQAHSLRVLKRLIRPPFPQARLIDGLLTHEDHHALLAAALLHDVGKSRHPLKLWERVVIVLFKSFFPKRFRDWSAGSSLDDKGLDGLSWRRPFIIAEQHPRWGAEMAAEAGSSPLVVSLILRHQNKIDSDPLTLEDRLLKCLQAADSTS